MRDDLLSTLKRSTHSDVALTYYHEKECMAVLDARELLTQLKYWKTHAMEVRKSNVRRVTLNEHVVYLFVVQPSSEALLAQMPCVCPFSVALGLMVTGVGYVCKTRETLDLVLRYIGVEGGTPNPLFA
jgi:hypothetical protein